MRGFIGGPGKPCMVNAPGGGGRTALVFRHKHWRPICNSRADVYAEGTPAKTIRLQKCGVAKGRRREARPFV
jgi:hypothetical protein